MKTLRSILASVRGPFGSTLAASLIWIPIGLGASLHSSAQEAAQGTEAAPVAISQIGVPQIVVPQQIHYAGKISDRAGAAVEAEFRIYAVQEGGEPLWAETQPVTPAKDGSYSVLLGSASAAGLPQSVFAGGAARWLGVSVDHGQEQERVLLSSVPYAMKSADAESLDGHAAADFVTQTQLASLAGQRTASPDIQPDTSGTVTGSGRAGTVPLWTGALTQGNSIITQVGSDIGMNNATPAATLDVGGTATIRGMLTVPPEATATTAGGYRSELLQLGASAWSTTTAGPVNQNFNLVTLSSANNTANPSGVLTFQFQQGTAPVTDILSMASNGVLTFAPTQTFPGTIKSVAGTSPVTASTSAGAVTMGLNTSALETTLNGVYAQLGAANTFTKPITFAPGQTFPITGTGGGTITGITTSSPLTGSGTSGSVALGVNTAALETTLNGVYPQLGGVNTFAQNQTMSKGLTVGGTAGANLVNSTTGYQLGGVSFDTGNTSIYNASLGFSSSPNETGAANLGIGEGSLAALTSGAYNVAVGVNALTAEVGGAANVAIGFGALNGNTSGGFNTAIGDSAGSGVGGMDVGGGYNTYIGFAAGPGSNSSLVGATAIGNSAVVNENYAVVLGGTGVNAANVGIGTATPFNDYALDVEAVTLSQINGGVVANAGGGNIYLGMTNGTHKFRVDTNGEVWADGGYQTSGADFAESVAVRGGRSEYEPGDLLAIDAGGTRRLTLARTPYTTRVAGIYSTKPGMLATPHDIDDPRPQTTEVPLAVVGIVPCKATAENGPIRVGDLMVASSHPGYAMKGTQRSRMLGAVVGKALEPLDKGSGVIQVLVTLQ